jgi:hypothetical protein
MQKKYPARETGVKPRYVATYVSADGAEIIEIESHKFVNLDAAVRLGLVADPRKQSEAA